MKTSNRTTLQLRNSILRAIFIAGLLPALIGIEAAASAAESPAPSLKVAKVSRYPVPEQKEGEQALLEVGLGDRIAVTITGNQIDAAFIFARAHFVNVL